MGLDKFINKSMSRWMEGDGPQNTVVISSRVRLARNLAKWPFPSKAQPKQLEEVRQQILRWWNKEGLKDLGQTKFLSIGEMGLGQRLALADKHLISPNLARQQYGAVLLNSDESVSIMVNEEDHLRIQALLPGLQLDNTWKLANQADDLLDAGFRYAWSGQWGFLTSCPTNVGTGLRASVMLHLPGLALSGQLAHILGTIGKLGIVARGLYGEGSDVQGNVYQISNQITLGQSEEEIIEGLNRVAVQIIHHELEARKTLLEQDRLAVTDRVWRAYGILANARVITSNEALELLSAVRLGIDMQLINGVDPVILNTLLVFTRPGYLQNIFDRELNPRERDSHRAQIIREVVNQGGGNDV